MVNLKTYLNDGALYLVRANNLPLAVFTSAVGFGLVNRDFSLHHSTCRSYAFTPNDRSQCGHFSETEPKLRFAALFVELSVELTDVVDL